jgi:YggT family protein
VIILCWAISAYTIVILGAVIMSWFPIAPGGPADSVFRVLRSLTDPVLVPLRRVIPPVGGMLDLSPMIVLLVLQLVLRPLVCG